MKSGLRQGAAVELVPVTVSSLFPQGLDGGSAGAVGDRYVDGRGAGVGGVDVDNVSL